MVKSQDLVGELNYPNKVGSINYFLATYDYIQTTLAILNFSSQRKFLAKH